MFSLHFSMRHAILLISLTSLALLGPGSCASRSQAEVGVEPGATVAQVAQLTATPIPLAQELPGIAPPTALSVSTEPLLPTAVSQNKPPDEINAPVQAPASQVTQQVLLPTIINGTSSIATGWHQLGGDPQRTHFVAANLPAPSGPMSTRNEDWRVLWIWNGPTEAGGPSADHLSLPDSVVPIAGDGRIYVGDDTGTVRALSAADGAELWNRSVGGQILNAGAYDPNTQAVYFASANGRLYKLGAANGDLLGELDASSAIEGAVLLVGERAYIGTAGGQLVAVNLANMTQAWAYEAEAAIYASSAYATTDGGLIILTTEDGSVHAVSVTSGARAWRTPINTALRPERPTRPERRFPDLYPVVAEQAGVVIVRSYFDWDLTWTPNGGAPANQEETRQYLADRPQYESFFVLDLATGERRFTAPVLGGAIGNGSYYYSSPPQAVVRRLPDGRDVAYLLWRNRSACRLEATNCDGREDTTFGEMDLDTGVIRFIQDYKNEGTIRFPTDEQGALSMIGDVLFHSHWMSLGAIRIPDRSVGGASHSAPIPSQEYLSISNTLAADQCPERNAAQRFCPVGHQAPNDSYQLDPGFYIYAYNTRVYDQFWHPPVRSPIFDNDVLYWRSSDGAIVALAQMKLEKTNP